jgi:hypothetical protein
MPLRYRRLRSVVHVALGPAALLSWSALVGCASGGGNDAGVVTRDTGTDSGAIDAPRDTPVVLDVGMPDVPAPDAGPGCGGVVCTGFSRCVDGVCVDYPPCRGDLTCPTPGDVCTARVCVPGGDDPDGDGSPARDDCDETDPTRSPLLPEVCNARDDNCNGAADDGDPATMCSLLPMLGVCMSGTCSCPAGTFDFDIAVPGCECSGTPSAGAGVSCDAAIALGDFPDTGTMVNVSANLLNGAEVWYAFNAIDTPDSSCDNFHVRVELQANPGGAYDMTVLRGSCTSTECDGTPVTDYSWQTDFRADVAGRLSGECPCTTADVPGLDETRCVDSGSAYFIRVRRIAGVAPACDPFVIQVSNGVFST